MWEGNACESLTSYDAESIQNINSDGEDRRKDEPGAEATYGN